MTPEEAIKTIQVAVAEVEWEYALDYDIAFETAIEALEKQIPKKPIPYSISLGEEPVKIGRCFYHQGANVHICPNCSNFISITNVFCFWCGQALDWSDTE